VVQTYNSRDWRDYRDRVAEFRDVRRMQDLAIGAASGAPDA
jgi:hypothetical protein